MKDSLAHSVSDDAPQTNTSSDCPELRRLAEARAVLENARRQAKWRRECKNLQAASHAVRAAAIAAHNAGIGWTEIGDALGIVRASSPA